MTLDQFAALLATRLRSRYDVAGGVFYLDLRAKAFGNRAPMVIRDHTAAGWPARGTPLAAPPREDVKAYAAAQRAAEHYVRRHYAPQVYTLVHAARPTGTPGSPTVEEACERYLEAAEAELGERHNTVKARRTALRGHAIQGLGAKPLAALTREEVEGWIQGLLVWKRAGRRRRKRQAASLGYKEVIIGALVAVWEATFPNQECPFRSANLDDGQARRDVRKALEEGLKEVLLRDPTGALTPDEVRRALVAATAYDERLGTDPRWRHIAVANTAPLIAMQVGTGARIGELALLRWWMVFEDLGVILIPGTKSKSALRLIPIQDGLRPWLQLLKRLACPDGGKPDEMTFLFPTNRRGRGVKPNNRRLQSKVAHALRLAGLKVPNERMVGKATHWARSTHISWGSVAMKYVEPQWLSVYVGHRDATLAPFKRMSEFGAVTLQYISSFAAEMPKRHRQYIRHLPTPAAVQKALADFEPVPLPWRERCTERKPRTLEDEAKQRARLEQLRTTHRKKERTI